MVLLAWIHWYSKQQYMECWKPTCTTWKASEFVKNWCLVRSISKTNCGSLFFEYKKKLWKIIQIFWLTSALFWKTKNRTAGWFQKDGATAHTAKTATAFMQNFLGDRTVGRGLWPPPSPDRTAPDYCLLGFLTERVYRNKPRSLEGLKSNTEEAVAGTDQQTLRKLAKKKTVKKSGCLQEGGGHFPHLL